MPTALWLIPSLLLAQAEPPPRAQLGQPSTAATVKKIETAAETPAEEADDEPMPSEASSETAPAESPSILFRPYLADRSSLSWTLGSGKNRFNMIDWEARPNPDHLWWLGRWPSSEPAMLFAEIGFNIHWWSGPMSTPAINLPPRVYDLYADLTWAQKWSDRFITEVRVQPGLYTDFRTTPPDAFRVPGQAVGIFVATPELMLVGGVQHIQRNEVKLLPVAGLLWQPTPSWELRLLFPEPKIAFEMSSSHKVWGYVAAEYGGGRWTYKDDAGHSERVEYSDDRVLFGIEWREDCLAKLPLSTPKATAFLEFGYLFGRQLRFTGPVADFDPKPTWMIRFGHAW
jgi:hypothetical protein